MKSLLLGSAALVVGVGTAMAADAPKAEPASEYMRICDAFGQGFWYIPGSDTCLNIGGYVRAETHFVGGDVGLLLGGPYSDFDYWTSRARANVKFDARTSTGFGLVKTYIELQMSVGPDDFASDYSGTTTELSAAFVEVSNDHGTFTAGHTGSFFDFYGSDDYGTRIDIDDNTTEQNLFAYTLNMTTSLRGTLSVEDPNSSGRRLDGADPHAGQQVPDLVANLRLDQEWGSAQVMGVVRDNHDANGSAVGFAFGAGVTVTLPVKDIGFSVQAGYADGALGYITTDPGGLGDMGGPNADDSNTAWNVRAGLTAPLTEQLSAWLDGSFTHVEDSANDDNYDFWAVVVGAEYSPNDVLAMGPEFAYNNINGDDPGEDGSIWGLMWRIQSSF